MGANRQVDYDWHPEFLHGSHYGVAWIGFIVLLSVAILANVAVYMLMRLSPRLNRSSASVILQYLSMEGALFSLSCMIQCALNVSIGSYFGDHAACEVQAVTHLFFVLSSGSTLCCIAYNSERKISNHTVLTNREIFIFHMIAFALSALISILSAVVLADARIMPGALYCLISLDDLAAGLVFYSGVAFILGFLVHRYYLIYLRITQDASIVSRQFKSNADNIRKRQLASVKKMVLIVITYVVCASPLLLLTLYERIANTDAPAVAYIWAGYMIHVNSLVNCTLYVWMNTYTREALYVMIGVRKQNSRLFAATTSLQTVKSGPQQKTIKRPQIPPSATVIPAQGHSLLPYTSQSNEPLQSERSHNAASKYFALQMHKSSSDEPDINIIQPTNHTTDQRINPSREATIGGYPAGSLPGEVELHMEQPTESLAPLNFYIEMTKSPR